MKMRDVYNNHFCLKLYTICFLPQYTQEYYILLYNGHECECECELVYDDCL